MTLPALLFGFILAALYGAGFHFWKADELKKILLYLVLSEIGFWSGHALGSYLGWAFAPIGPLYAGMATLGSVVFLFGGWWLSQVDIERE